MRSLRCTPATYNGKRRCPRFLRTPEPAILYGSDSVCIETRIIGIVRNFITTKVKDYTRLCFTIIILQGDKARINDRRTATGADNNMLISFFGKDCLIIGT